MSYNSQNGKRPNEYASKSSHQNIIKDKDVIDFLENCSIPYKDEDIEIDLDMIIDVPKISTDSIKSVVTIDGGYTKSPVQNVFPSAVFTFFQFGANLLDLNDIEELDRAPFISPEDMSKIRNLDRYKMVLPTNNISYKGESLLFSVRRTVYDFFKTNNLLGVVKWFIYEEFSDTPKDIYEIKQNPINQARESIIFHKTELDNQYILDYNGDSIFITDIFRLHEAVDEDLGATGILGYITPLIEQFLIIKAIKDILEHSPNLLNNVLFIRDGFLGFSGQTARLHQTMRILVNYLFDKHNLFLVGIEKSGAFVEHANIIKHKLKNGSALMLTNDYIYKYIVPKTKDTNQPYASTSYYSGKLIIKTFKGNILVITLPTRANKVFTQLNKEWYINLNMIFNVLDKLNCNYYDNSLLPVALVNKLVSLSDKPSSQILTKFAKDKIN